MSDLEAERRMEIDRFVCRENIARFRHLLTTDPNERELKMLIRLLAEEQEKRRRLRWWTGHESRNGAQAQRSVHRTAKRKTL